MTAEPVESLVSGRVDVYGNPVDTFVRAAQIWSGILDREVHAHEVALCMLGFKLMRTSVTPNYSDNSDDIQGYLEIFRQIIGPDMVHARTVAEYAERVNR